MNPPELINPKDHLKALKAPEKLIASNNLFISWRKSKMQTAEA
jgi:hypothetical protein